MAEVLRGTDIVKRDPEMAEAIRLACPATIRAALADKQVQMLYKAGFPEEGHWVDPVEDGPVRSSQNA